MKYLPIYIKLEVFLRRFRSSLVPRYDINRFIIFFLTFIVPKIMYSPLLVQSIKPKYQFTIWQATGLHNIEGELNLKVITLKL